MKRKIVTAVFIVVFFLMQTTVFQHLAFASISPNFMIILASSYGFMRGKKEGMIVGFVSGLFMDVFYGVGSMIGAYALIYLLIGYGNGFFNRMFFEDDIKLPILLISAISDASSGSPSKEIPASISSRPDICSCLPESRKFTR